MTPKLPAKTFRLKLRKRRGLYVAVIINLIVCITLFRLSYLLDLGSGRYMLLILGAISAVICLVSLAGLLRSRREGFVGLFISGQGINDISTGHTYGMVQWKDVYKIKVVEDVECPRYKYIIIKVVNPQTYIDREVSTLKRRSLVLKFHHYGSPVCFSNRALDCTFEELYDTVMRYYENYQIRQEERRIEKESREAGGKG